MYHPSISSGNSEVRCYRPAASETVAAVIVVVVGGGGGCDDATESERDRQESCNDLSGTTGR